MAEAKHARHMLLVKMDPVCTRARLSLHLSEEKGSDSIPWGKEKVSLHEGFSQSGSSLHVQKSGEIEGVDIAICPVWADIVVTTC